MKILAQRPTHIYAVATVLLITRETTKERQRDRQTETERETERERDRQTDRQTQGEKENERDRQTDRQRVSVCVCVCACVLLLLMQMMVVVLLLHLLLIVKRCVAWGDGAVGGGSEVGVNNIFNNCVSYFAIKKTTPKSFILLLVWIEMHFFFLPVGANSTRGCF